METAGELIRQADTRFQAEWSSLCQVCPWATSFQGLAFAGTWSMFDKAGFAVVGETRAEGSGRPRLVMRRDC